MLNPLDMDDFDGMLCDNGIYPLLTALYDQLQTPLVPTTKRPFIYKADSKVVNSSPTDEFVLQGVLTQNSAYSFETNTNSTLNEEFTTDNSNLYYTEIVYVDITETAPTAATLLSNIESTTEHGKALSVAKNQTLHLPSKLYEASQSVNYMHVHDTKLSQTNNVVKNNDTIPTENTLPSPVTIQGTSVRQSEQQFIDTLIDAEKVKTQALGLPHMINRPVKETLTPKQSIFHPEFAKQTLTSPITLNGTPQSRILNSAAHTIQTINDTTTYTQKIESQEGQPSFTDIKTPIIMLSKALTRQNTGKQLVKTTSRNDQLIGVELKENHTPSSQQSNTILELQRMPINEHDIANQSIYHAEASEHSLKDKNQPKALTIDTLPSNTLERAKKVMSSQNPEKLNIQSNQGLITETQTPNTLQSNIIASKSAITENQLKSNVQMNEQSLVGVAKAITNQNVKPIRETQSENNLELITQPMNEREKVQASKHRQELQEHPLNGHGKGTIGQQAPLLNIASSNVPLIQEIPISTLQRRIDKPNNQPFINDGNSQYTFDPKMLTREGHIIDKQIKQVTSSRKQSTYVGIKGNKTPNDLKADTLKHIHVHSQRPNDPTKHQSKAEIERTPFQPFGNARTEPVAEPTHVKDVLDFIHQKAPVNPKRVLSSNIIFNTKRKVPVARVSKQVQSRKESRKFPIIKPRFIFPAVQNPQSRNVVRNSGPDVVKSVGSKHLVRSKIENNRDGSAAKSNSVRNPLKTFVNNRNQQQIANALQTLLSKQNRVQTLKSPPVPKGLPNDLRVSNSKVSPQPDFLSTIVRKRQPEKKVNKSFPSKSRLSQGLLTSDTIKLPVSSEYVRTKIQKKLLQSVPFKVPSRQQTKPVFSFVNFSELGLVLPNTK